MSEEKDAAVLRLRRQSAWKSGKELCSMGEGETPKIGKFRGVKGYGATLRRQRNGNDPQREVGTAFL